MKLIALALLSSASLAVVDPLPNDELSWLTGEWRGGGTSFAQPSIATLELRPTLHGAFFELSYSVRTTGPKPFSFEGRAFYRRTERGKWQAWWFDSQGTYLPISATLSNNHLTAEWGADGASRGRTSYRELTNGRIEVVDWAVQKDGSWREFARQQLEKAK